MAPQICVELSQCALRALVLKIWPTGNAYHGDEPAAPSEELQEHHHVQGEF